MLLSLKKSLIKDYNLPITLLESPYWEHQIGLLEKYYSIEDKIKKQASAYNNLGESFFKVHEKLVNEVVTYLQGKPEYEKIQALVIDNEKTPQYQRLFNPSNNNKEFISFDLIKANFNVLYLSNPELFDNLNTYDNFLKQFTQEDYFLESKKIRQVIFGNLNPKRQQALQKQAVASIKKVLLKFIKEEDIMFTSSDEIIVNNFSKVNEVLTDESLSKYKNIIKIKNFKLKQIVATQPFYVKESEGKVEFKQVPSQCLLEVIREYQKETPQELDRHFFHEGRVVKALKSLFEK